MSLNEDWSPKKARWRTPWLMSPTTRKGEQRPASAAKRQRQKQAEVAGALDEKEWLQLCAHGRLLEHSETTWTTCFWTETMVKLYQMLFRSLHWDTESSILHIFSAAKKWCSFQKWGNYADKTSSLNKNHVSTAATVSHALLKRRSFFRSGGRLSLRSRKTATATGGDLSKRWISSQPWWFFPEASCVSFS